MKIFLDTFTGGDYLLLTFIFGLDHRKIYSKTLPLISKTGDGYLYPFIPLLIYLVEPDIAIPVFLALLFGFAAELPLYIILKRCIKRKRPYTLNKNIYNRINPSDYFSFPSGHTGAAFVVITVAVYYFPSLFWLLFLYGLLVGVSRVYLGVHYPSDILAGTILGIAGGWFGINLLEYFF